ncbi:MAG: 5'-methylthioadenosine/adenosylhomocysteine nucleosidase [Ruminococcaceae bacterium]|nr:5'-methylthioadenosine/adenosylhomocysteine nucleosidase [Oscillospiraceae bacterium]
MIGIIGAMALEVENLVKELENKREEQVGGIRFYLGLLAGKEVVLAVCGVGKCFAAICAQTMILTYCPECVINIGVAGALHPELQVGDMAIAVSAVQHDMDTSPIGDPLGLISGINLVELPCDQALCEKIAECAGALGYRTMTGIVASGDQFVADIEKKQWIAKTFGAIDCEMEGAAIVQTCYQSGVPCGVIRSISDSLTGNGMDFESFKHLAASHSTAVVKALLEAL